MCAGCGPEGRYIENGTEDVMELRGKGKRGWLEITQKGCRDDLPTKPGNLCLILGTHMME